MATSLKNVLEFLENESNEITCKVAAEEVLKWLITNVENYIDNYERTFNLNIIIDAKSVMPNMQLLQDLYKYASDQFPDKKDENKLAKCYTYLNKITMLIYDEITENKKLLDELFTRMVYYYEVACIKDGKIVENKLNGAVEITYFNYEPFDVGVEVKKITPIEQENGEIKETRELVKEYKIPEGFAITLEIAFKTSFRPNSLF